MERDAVIGLLRQHEAELKELGVEHRYLFGSVARIEAGSDSDVGLFFDYARGELGLFQLMDVKKRAAQLGCKTDIVLRQAA